MATEQEYWNRLRRAAIACLSTSLRHGSPAMMDVLCELERAVYDGMAEPVAPVAPDHGLREAIVKAMQSCVYPCGTYEIPVTNHEKAAEKILSVLAERGVR